MKERRFGRSVELAVPTHVVPTVNMVFIGLERMAGAVRQMNRPDMIMKVPRL